MKKCELCTSIARMYCDSDRANLCWDCDAKVHTANFLVAKHTRTLLCQACQSPTPWTGSGPKLGPIASICEACVHGNNSTKNNNGPDENDDEEEEEEEVEEEEGEGEEEEDDDDSNDSDDGDEDDGENQVVPLSFQSPPLVSSCSSGEESSGRLHSGREIVPKISIGLSLKRTRENSDV